MYNPKLKKKFMKYYTVLNSDSPTMLQRAQQAMERIAKYEESWNEDICVHKNIDDLQEVFDNFSGNSSSYSNGQLSPLREYCKWCFAIGEAKTKPEFLNIKKRTPHKMTMNTVGSPLELQMHLNKCFDPDTKENIHIVYRSYFWLAFIGFTQSEAFKITIDEVDLENLVIIHGDLKLPIYKEGFPTLKKCKELTEFIIENANYKKGERRESRMPGNLLLRGCKQNPGKHLNTECSRNQIGKASDDETDVRLNYKTVWHSGIFYWMLQQEQIGIKPDFTNIAIRKWADSRSNQSRGLETEFNPDNLNHLTYVNNARRALERDYKTWKKAHYKK